MTPPLLEVQNISKSYESSGLWARNEEKHNVLQDVSFTLASQGCLSLMGRSGEGKSTLVRIILGLDKPNKGQVLVQGKDVHASLTAGDMRMRMNLQVVFQNAFASLNPRLTIARSIAEPLRNLGFGAQAIDEKVTILLEQVELAGHGAAFPCQLSGGQLQRVCLARALAPQPAVLILDEAFSGLDMLVQARMVALLHTLRSIHGLSCIMVTHDARLAAAFSQRMLVMHSGRIVAEANSVDTLRQCPHPAVQELTKAVLHHSPQSV